MTHKSLFTFTHSLAEEKVGSLPVSPKSQDSSSISTIPTTPPSINMHHQAPPPYYGYPQPYGYQQYPPMHAINPQMMYQQQQYMQQQFQQQQYQQQYSQQYNQYNQQQQQQQPQASAAPPQVDATDPSQASPIPFGDSATSSASSTPVPEKISTSSPNPIPPSEGSSPVPATTSISSPSSPIQFSKIISFARNSLVAPIPRVAIANEGSAFTPTSSSASIPTFKIISSQMREFKKFPSMSSRLEVWCKCDFCKFFAMNGVQSNPKDMKMLIIDKEITFLSYLFRMPCKCGSKNAAGCTHPKLNTSMFYSHEEDNDPFPEWLEEDWSNRCTLFHCWNSRCTRKHHPLTLRDAKKV
jgi:hypothetical protein